MRPQQNRRMRGRGNNNNNNNNRRSPNPLSRNYESNGPDVKIRGNAQHIAEKYAALARDAQASGDRVTAENYLQHAEHYNRIIMAAQAQMPQPVIRDDVDDEDSEITGGEDDTQNITRIEVVAEPAGSGPQPTIQGTPAEVALSEEENSTKAIKAPRRAPRRRATRPSTEAPVESVSAQQVAEASEPAIAETAPSEKREALNVADTGTEKPLKPKRGRRPKVVVEEA